MKVTHNISDCELDAIKQTSKHISTILGDVFQDSFDSDPDKLLSPEKAVEWIAFNYERVQTYLTIVIEKVNTLEEKLSKVGEEK